jgi:hypothetical protein
MVDIYLELSSDPEIAELEAEMFTPLADLLEQINQAEWSAEMTDRARSFNPFCGRSL